MTSEQSSEPDTALAGRTRWRRFVGLLVPTALVLALMIIAVVNGLLPVSVAAEGQQRIKIKVDQMRAITYGAFPRFFQTQDGERHTVVVVGLSQVRASGVCGSGKVETPLGDYVLRVETNQPLQAADLKLAIENIDGASLAGQSLSLNRHKTAPDGTPVDSGHEGTIPITARSVLLDLHADVRWVTTSGLQLSGIDLTAGLDVQECF